MDICVCCWMSQCQDPLADDGARERGVYRSGQLVTASWDRRVRDEFWRQPRFDLAELQRISGLAATGYSETGSLACLICRIKKVMAVMRAENLGTVPLPLYLGEARELWIGLSDARKADDAVLVRKIAKSAGLTIRWKRPDEGLSGWV